jgi:cytochrome c oxidase assembly protein subunit 15
MTHRYFAGGLGLLIVLLAIWAIVRRARGVAPQPVLVPLLLVAIAIFQAMLGMWTVTWQLLPLVVMGHLLGGMTIAALLWWITLKSGQCFRRPTTRVSGFAPWAWLGLLIVFGQIFLGGWTSANYAALPCAHFPFCQGSLFPQMDFVKAFNFMSPIGQNYEGGHLDFIGRVTIQMMHRYGAMITALYVGVLSLVLVSACKATALRGIGWSIVGLLCLQFTLGVLNIEWVLPLPIAVMHNGGAALLLLAMVALVYQVGRKPSMESGA